MIASSGLTGSVALVTGASSGIGAATARALAAEGATVALAARRVDRLEDLAREIRESGGTALTVEADVTEPSAAEAVVQRTVAEYGALDILVNNAGVMLLGPILDAGRGMAANGPAFDVGPEPRPEGCEPAVRRKTAVTRRHSAAMPAAVQKAACSRHLNAMRLHGIHGRGMSAVA
ncbi:MAG: SDR family NAD(P)-dependent oxidoreductase [Geodermatophilaceae bacterium]